MRCIHCGENSDYQARVHKACPACGHRFAFEPLAERRMTDLTFSLALDAVSDRGGLAWTDDQLYHELCRRVRRRRLYDRLMRRPTPSLARWEFASLYKSWTSAHRLPAGRLQGRQFEPGVAPDVAACGFERLVVCESEAIADVLLVNRFHAEAKCPVLAYSGYPEHISEALVPLLRERPPETVVVVHDATWEGCGLAQAITEEPRWFGGVTLPRVIDAGLRPADARRFRGLYERADEAGDAPGVDDAEAKWLSKYSCELAVARPRVLMSVLASVLRGEAVGGLVAAGGVLWAAETWGDGDDDVG
jgi:hypothetical protein